MAAIERFREDCEMHEYTDVGAVWELLEAIHCGLRGASPYGEMGDLSRDWPPLKGDNAVKLIEDWDVSLMIHNWPECGPGAIKVEDLYQAFKARLTQELRVYVPSSSCYGDLTRRPE